MYNDISNETLQIISNEVRQKFGLHFPEYRFKDLVRGLINAGNLKGIDLNSYIKLFVSKLLSTDDLDELGNCLTVGETYFFRDKKLFEVLRKNVIPNIIHSKRDSKKITIWSSGCSTGEEAYSIAILMKELLVDFSSWNINIIATDINLNSLRKAKQATYGEWSFRENDDTFKKRYFDMLEPKQYKLKDEIKKNVTFSYLNLVSEVYAIDSKLLQDVDILFCRNVLMYFNEEQVKKIVSRYYHIINNKGWLIVAPSESLFLNKTEFIPYSINGVFLYGKAGERKFESLGSEDKKYNNLNFDIINREEVNLITKKKVYHTSKANFNTESVQPVVNDQEVDYEELCREKANQGNLQEALTICEKAISQNKVNPRYYYLFASIEQELGNIEDAVDALRKTIYLDSNFVMAYFDLGNLLLKLGKNREAFKSFDNVNMLLQEFKEEQSIPNAEAVTAGMLKYFVANILKEREIYGDG